MIQSFNEHRQSLLGLAYRIVGSVSDAEDILQEAFIRWSQNARAV
ncbi:MAG: RNA polymerase sigma factor SigJ, partial [Ketobacter sp.]